MSIESQVETILFEAIKELNEELPADEHVETEKTTRLFGENASMDSMGLVTLIVSVEQKVQAEFDLALTIADEKAMSQANSPFRTVSSLADYLVELLNEQGRK